MNPVGIFGAIKLSQTAFDLFCAQQGRALVADVKYIAANGHAAGLHMQRLEAFGKSNPTQMQASEFFAKHAEPDYVLTPEGYFHEAGNQLMVQYEASTQTLFYMYVLNFERPQEMAEAPSFRIFQKIAQYKGINSTDYVVFSSDMPNFLRSSLWRVYAVTSSGFVQQENTVALPIKKELWRLTEKFYYGAKVYPDDGYAEPLRTIVKADIESLLKILPKK